MPLAVSYAMAEALLMILIKFRLLMPPLDAPVSIDTAGCRHFFQVD